MRPASSALTLVEILAVVVILGLMASLLTFGIVAKVGSAKQKLARTQALQIAQQLDLMLMERPDLRGASSRWMQGLRQDAGDPWHVSEEQMRDPWGRPFILLTPGPKGAAYEIVSFGADGKQGGTGDGADISYSPGGKQ